MEQNVFEGTQDNNSNQGSEPVVAPSAAPSEKSFTQSQVNRIMGDLRKELRETQAEKTRLESQFSTQNQSVTSVGGMQSWTPDDLRRIAAEEAQKTHETITQQYQQRMMQQEGQKVLDSFVNKLQAAKEKYPDIEEVVGTLPLDKMASVIGLATSMDGTADIMYEIGKHPSKLAQAMMLANLSPDHARGLLNEIGQSIRLNEQAKNFIPPREPLSQISASPVSMDNGSAQSVSDFRRMFKGRH